VRPPGRPSSFFFHPLDTILGTVGVVRVLRVLSLHRGSMPAAALARRAGLGRPGTGRVLDRLVESGIVEATGAGRSSHYRLAEGHSLGQVVRELFSREAAGADRFLAQVRAAARRMRPPPRAVWLVGSVARGQDQLQSDLDLAVVHTKRSLDEIRKFNRAALKAAGDLGLGVSLVVFTPEDLAEHARSRSAWWRNLVADAIPILGPAPGSLVNG
jgi:predicted nucleotidyltransferase